jgi:hypothetical protein
MQASVQLSSSRERPNEALKLSRRCAPRSLTPGRYPSRTTYWMWSPPPPRATASGGRRVRRQGSEVALNVIGDAGFRRSHPATPGRWQESVGAHRLAPGHVAALSVSASSALQGSRRSHRPLSALLGTLQSRDAVARFRNDTASAFGSELPIAAKG